MGPKMRFASDNAVAYSCYNAPSSTWNSHSHRICARGASKEYSSPFVIQRARAPTSLLCACVLAFPFERISLSARVGPWRRLDHTSHARTCSRWAAPPLHVAHSKHQST